MPCSLRTAITNSRDLWQYWTIRFAHFAQVDDSLFSIVDLGRTTESPVKSRLCRPLDYADRCSKNKPWRGDHGDGGGITNSVEEATSGYSAVLSSSRMPTVYGRDGTMFIFWRPYRESGRSLRRRASADADQLRTGEPNASSRETGHLLQYPNANANVASATD
jgi:hypothetical protein